MRKFEFSLARVLDYRLLLEEWAKDAYLEAQLKRRRVDEALEFLFRRREIVMAEEPQTVDDYRALSNYLDRLQDEERDLRAIQELMLADEETARLDWVQQRQDADALVKLKEKQEDEWKLELSRWEQKQLDEWTTTRRKSA
jgi:flagellar FliJ protein